MSQPEFMRGPEGRRLAFHRQSGGRGPWVVFLGGLRSDMEGTKALALAQWAAETGQNFLRFDYSGHGQSEGRFEEGAIGDWLADARAVIAAQTQGPLVLVGSSMGGWISLLLAREWGARIQGLVGIAAAPDFTEDGYWASFTEDQRDRVMQSGQIALPSEYGAPMIVTRRLIEDGRDHLVLRRPLSIAAPVRLLQGTADEAVPTATALRLLDHLQGGDIRLELVKGADHRFSDAACLAALTRSLTEILD